MYVHEVPAVAKLTAGERGADFLSVIISRRDEGNDRDRETQRRSWRGGSRDNVWMWFFACYISQSRLRWVGKSAKVTVLWLAASSSTSTRSSTAAPPPAAAAAATAAAAAAAAAAEMLQCVQLLLLVAILLCCGAYSKQTNYDETKVNMNGQAPLADKMEAYFKVKPSVKSWDEIDSPNKISLVSMHVDHNSDNSWYIRAQHEKDSFGWNRSLSKPFMARPYGCSVRFIGVGLESTLQGFEEGGMGYLALDFKNNDGKRFYHGFDKNETNKVYCYYSTNKDTGSNFQVRLILCIVCIVCIVCVVYSVYSAYNVTCNYYIPPLGPAVAPGHTHFSRSHHQLPFQQRELQFQTRYIRRGIFLVVSYIGLSRRRLDRRSPVLLTCV